MSLTLPSNITKQDLLKAIDKIDEGGIPTGADSKYYDVLYKGNRYPPKLIVSLSNIFANGVEIDRNTFEGGIGTPSFKLLESNGFIIEKKKTVMNKIKIYEIKSSASVNAPSLSSIDEKFFYWDDAQFTNNSVGDRIFFINQTHKWALFTEIKTLNIPATYRVSEKKSVFEHNNNIYSAEDPDGRYKEFIQFELKQPLVSIPKEWKWTTSLGAPQIFDLWRDDRILDNTEKRIEKIDDLLKIFENGEANVTLQEARKLLQGENVLKVDILNAIKNKTTQDIINENIFHFEKAREQLENFKQLSFPNAFYKKILSDYNDAAGTFENFVEEKKDIEELKFLNSLGKLISYIDAKASGKAKWNKYEDRRSVAHSGIYQNDWVKNLVKYKENGNKSNDLSPGIQNALHFLENPLKGINMLSEKHKEMVSRKLLNKKYKDNVFIKDLDEFFNPYNITCNFLDNINVVYSHILYQPNVKKIWFENNDKIPKKEINSMTPKEIINNIHNYISEKGFQYKYEEIANFYLSLKTKPFVILAGISGTGKTQLPRKFAEALGMDSQVIQIPVRPDWTDGSDLLGYTSLDGSFKPKSLTLAIQEAFMNSENPYFFILDEMNLARVEHYFSDFLSIIETRKWDKNQTGLIKTDPILREDIILNAKNATEFKALEWPQNLYLIGTVNMDETTHTFSRKVLDRANTIEMNEVNLNWISISSTETKKINGISNSFLETEFIGSLDITKENKDSIINEIELLIRINKVLERADLHFAYRVRDEVAFYLIINKKYDLIDKITAMDFQLVQKVLPRIHGSSERVQSVLLELLNILEGKDFKDNNFDYSQIEEKIDINNLKYKRSSKKIIYMLKRFDEDRFTSFWI